MFSISDVLFSWHYLLPVEVGVRIYFASEIIVIPSINQSINPLACTECGDSVPFSGASSIPPCHTLFPATPLRRPFFHPPSLHPAIYFLVYLLVLLFPDSCTILFWEFYFLPFSVHVVFISVYNFQYLEQEKAARQFHANPVPASLKTPNKAKQHSVTSTEPSPFQLEVDKRGMIRQQQLKQKVTM